MNWWWSKKVKDKPEPRDDDEVTDFVVLRELKRTLRGYNDINVGNAPEIDLNKEQAEITRIKVWALALERGVVRRQYLSWLNWFQDGLNEAREELKVQRRKREMDEYRAKNDELFSRVNELKASGKIPSPHRDNNAG